MEEKEEGSVLERKGHAAEQAGMGLDRATCAFF